MASASWCKVASNLDSHPKIRRAGRNGREVFLFALRRNAEPGNPTPGSLPAMQLEPWYLADQLMMTEAEAADGLQRAVAAGLLIAIEGAYGIAGWDDDEWGRPFTGAERTRTWRDKRKPKPVTTGDEPVTPSDAPNVTDRHTVTLGDGCDGREERRSEEKRGEEIREKNSAPPAAGASRPSRARPKPNDPTPAELASVEVVLTKLTAQNGVKYTRTPQHTRLIVRQLRAGVSEMDLRAVIGYCADELGWKNKPEMEKYLRPETLFGSESIARYLDPARTWFEKLRAARAAAQPRRPDERPAEGAAA